MCHFPAHNTAYVLSTTVRIKSILLSLTFEALHDLIPVTSLYGGFGFFLNV